MEVAELRRRLHLRRNVPALQVVDLVEHDHYRDAEREHTLGDEAIAGADPLPRRENEEHRVDILERMVNRALHALRHRVERPLEAREVDEDELIAVAVDDACDSPALEPERNGPGVDVAGGRPARPRA